MRVAGLAVKRLPLQILVFALGVSTVAVARADGPPMSLTPPATLAIPVAAPSSSLPGEHVGDTTGLAPALAVLPVRLSLLGAAFPIAPALGGAPCASREEASGNTQSGFALQHQISAAWTPRLTLTGFSQLGCPLDAGMGGALTYSVPLARDVWLLASVGVYTLPGLQPGRVVAMPDARLDVLFQKPSGRGVAVGMGLRGFKLTASW